MNKSQETKRTDATSKRKDIQAKDDIIQYKSFPFQVYNGKRTVSEFRRHRCPRSPKEILQLSLFSLKNQSLTIQTQLFLKKI